MLNDEVHSNPMGYKPIPKLLLSLAVPAVIANVVNALYNIVDQIFVGQGVGYLGNAATNIAFPITTVCMAIGLMTGLGAAASFNLELGRGNPEVETSGRNRGRHACHLWDIVVRSNPVVFKAVDDIIRRH